MRRQLRPALLSTLSRQLECGTVHAASGASLSGSQCSVVPPSYSGRQLSAASARAISSFREVFSDRARARCASLARYNEGASSSGIRIQSAGCASQAAEAALDEPAGAMRSSAAAAAAAPDTQDDEQQQLEVTAPPGSSPSPSSSERPASQQAAESSGQQAPGAPSGDAAAAAQANILDKWQLQLLVSSLISDQNYPEAEQAFRKHLQQIRARMAKQKQQEQQSADVTSGDQASLTAGESQRLVDELGSGGSGQAVDITPSVSNMMPLPQTWNSYFYAMTSNEAPPRKMHAMVRAMESEWGQPASAQVLSNLIQRCSNVKNESQIDKQHAAYTAASALRRMQAAGMPTNFNVYMWTMYACTRSQDLGLAMRIFDQLQQSGLATRQVLSPRQHSALCKLYSLLLDSCLRSQRSSNCMVLLEELDALGMPPSAAIVCDVAMLAAGDDRTDLLLKLLQRLLGMRRKSNGRPIKVAQGSMMAALNCGARTADVAVAEAAWKVLRQSLAERYEHRPVLDEVMQKPWWRKRNMSGSGAVQQQEGEQQGLEAGEQQQGEDGQLEQQAEMTSAPTTEAPGEALAASVAEAAPSPPLSSAVPMVAAYHAMIHAYVAAGDTRSAFEMMSQLREAYPERQEVVLRYYPAMTMVVDALAQKLDRIDDAFYVLEAMQAEGKPIHISMLNCIIAACSQVGDLPRVFETLDATASLGLQPDIDTYNAAATGCVHFGRIDLMQKLFDEAKDLGLAPNMLTSDVRMWSFIVQSKTREIARMVSEAHGDVAAAAAAGGGDVASTADWARWPLPSMRAVSAGLEVCERAGDVESLETLMSYLEPRHYKIVGAVAKARRWAPFGGMKQLTGSTKFVSRRTLGGFSVPHRAGPRREH